MLLPDSKNITRWYLCIVALVGIIYAGLEWTPSSYGVFLQAMQAPDFGPILGTSRQIRSDEWSVNTPLVQAAVRNKFQRINETSFYREDLRNFVPLPLKDWSLIFKPQLWAFFLLPPATAFSIYWALFMSAFLAGYYLLFRRLGMPGLLAIAACVTVFFTGFTQFWWTTLGPSLAVLPWILVLILSPMVWWKKMLLCAWAFPAMAFAYAYPALLITMGWGALVIILAFRPALLKSPGTIAAVAVGAIAVAVFFHLYFGEIITVIRNTVYPGRRVSPSGDTSILAVLSEFFPFVSFRLGNYMHLDGENICEIGAVGSFLPLLTLCLLDYRALRDHRTVRRILLVLLAGFAAFTLWEITPLLEPVGKLLIWNRGASERWLFTSGLLLTIAALSIWSNQLVSLHPLRIFIFVFAGPFASILIKAGWLMHQGETAGVALAESRRDIVLCAFALMICVACWYLPPRHRAMLLLSSVAMINVYAFGRFNPVQPAGPIFDVPETDVVHNLREKAAASPGEVLADTQTLGATLNGLGLRSVAHILMAPQTALFRTYFPTMHEGLFNQIFNRYGHLQVANIPMPHVVKPDVVEVPIEPFRVVRNVRKLLLDTKGAGVCAQPSGGGIDRLVPNGDTLTINGWAPWKGESDDQGIRVLSSRSLVDGTLTTQKRPDLAESFQNYDFDKSGFELRISSRDGKPVRPNELTLSAFGTAEGDIRLACCTCP